MCRKNVCIVMVALMASYALAQGHTRRPQPRPPVVGLRVMHGPTTVTGEGTTTPSGLKYWDLQIGTGGGGNQGEGGKNPLNRMAGVWEKVGEIGGCTAA